MQIHTTEHLNRSFLDEYNSPESVRKYSSDTAGYGINYLLEHDYAQVYLTAIDECQKSSPATPLRLLEFGCGAGMNLTRLLSLLEAKGVAVERAYGTDFSVSLVQSAKQEAARFLRPASRDRVTFHVARNERLGDDLARESGLSTDVLAGSFDFIFGVNTFRYCHRLGNQDDCAAQVYRLLRPGGMTVNIDMNDRFPVFRSRLRRAADKPEECYLPTLEEYAAPFEAAGFEIMTKDHFCWVPHSAGAAMTFVARAVAPLLNVVARSYAMRSLIVARKAL